METLIGALQEIALAAGFWGILFVAFVQEVFPPLPSTVVAMSLGFLLFSEQTMNVGTLSELFFRVGLPVALGLTMGAVIIYSVVAWGGMAFIDRWGRWIGISRGDIDKLQGRLQGSAVDEVILFAARAFPLVPSVAVNIVAGLMRWKIWPFIILTFTGTIIRAMWAAAIGWQVGTAFERYSAAIERTHNFVLLILVLCGLVFIWHRRRISA